MKTSAFVSTLLSIAFSTCLDAADTSIREAALAAAAGKVQAAENAIAAYASTATCPDAAFTAEGARLKDMQAKLTQMDADVRTWALTAPQLLDWEKELAKVNARRAVLSPAGAVKPEDKAEFDKAGESMYWLEGARRKALVDHESPAHSQLRRDVESLWLNQLYAVRNKLDAVPEAKLLADAVRAADSERAAAQAALYRAQGVVTPAEWLKSQPKPSFRPGTTLPRLTRYGWTLPVDTRIELTENWGYALEFGGYVSADSVRRLDNPFSDESRLAALTKSDPKRYPMAVICTRDLPGAEAPKESWVRGNDGSVINGQLKSLDGTAWSEAAGAMFSPEAPASVWKLAGKYRADPLIALQKRGVPLSIVLNGGEYGVGVLGQAQPMWTQDPAIRAAVAAEPYNGSWQDYASEKKAISEHIIADVVRAGVPERDLYIYYTAGGGTLRNNYWGQGDWEHQWRHMRGISDLPGNEIYYKAFNSGFTGRMNMLSVALNATALEIASGDNVSYNWVCAGWARGNPKELQADLTRWAGFLKCYYTAGMIGANVGYYEVPPGGFEATFKPDETPEWLKQMVVSAHVHALFSQVEEIIRQGDLLPGTMPHGISPGEPAYEFPTGDEHARVLVRKLRIDPGKNPAPSPTWLVTAWASDGVDRPATVNIPELGRLTVQARVCGSVYRVAKKGGKIAVVQLDGEGVRYTRVNDSKPVMTVADLTLPKPPAEGQLLWLAADTGVTKGAAGKVSAWKSAGSAGLSMVQPDAGKQPQWVATACNGQPALHFANVEQLLSLASPEKAGKDFAGPLTLFLVATTIEKGDVRILSAGATVPDPADYIDGKGFKITADGPAPKDPKRPAVLKIKTASILEGLGSLNLGNTWNGAGFEGDVGELLIYRGHLPATTAALVRDYLNRKYDLTAP